MSFNSFLIVKEPRRLS